MGKVCTLEHTITFADCEMAWIVYFPRYLEMVSNLVEHWFTDCLDMPFLEFHLQHGLGAPLVNTRVEFMKSCRLGEQLQLELCIESLGRSSIVLRIRGLVSGEERLRLRHKMAIMSLQSRHAVSIPEDLRLRMEPFLAPGATRSADPRPHNGAIPANSFRSPQLVRFTHCDAAGIVFYPRFFDLMNAVQEDWFAQGLDCPWGTDLMGPRRLRIPPRAMTVEFLAACRLSETIDFDLWVTRLGRSSLDLALEGRVAGKPRLRAAMTSCMVDSGTSSPVPIPDDLRSRMDRFLVGT